MLTSVRSRPPVAVPRLSPLAVRPALRWLVVGVGYFALARLSTQAGLVREGVPLILLAQGVAYASVQLGGPRMAAAVAVGAAAEGFSEGLPVGAVLLLAAAAAGAGLTAYAVTWRSRLRPDGERLTDTLIRSGAATAAGTVAASFMLAANAVDGRLGRPGVDWLLLVLVNTASIIVVAPFVRAWVQRVAPGVALDPRTHERRDHD